MITGLGYSFNNNSMKVMIVNRIVRVLFKIALSFNRIVFFQNSDDMALFIDHNLLKSNEQAFIINGSGVDLDHYKYCPLPKVCSFLLIARLIKDKGIVEYVEAARLVKKKYPNTKFYLAGWIDSNPSMIKQSTLTNWVEEDIIEYLGMLSDVRPAIANCSIYVLPSYREGTPRTVLEAMAMGRAIITTNAPGCKETVIDGENGYLVPVRSIEQLAARMNELIENDELVKNMSRTSFEIATEKYDVHKVNNLILEQINLH